MNVLDTLKLSTAAKAWVGLVGTLLQVVLLNAPLPVDGPWHVTIGVALAVLTALGVYQVPNEPAPGTVPAVPVHSDDTTAGGPAV